jgi:colanic acid/amylovoran biosynthesis glycosyltransferase
MRIAVVVDRFPVLSETFVLSQITGLLDRGHDVDIVPTRPGGDAVVHADVDRYRLRERVVLTWPTAAARLRQAPVALGRVFGRRGVKSLAALNAARYGRDAWSLRLLHAASARLDGGAYDAVLCHFGPNARFAQRLRERHALDGPIAAVFHGWDLSRYLRRAGTRPYARLFAEGDLFLPISERWADRLRGLGCPADRIVVHHMGVDPARLSFTVRTLSPDEPVRLVSVARLVEKKGIEFGIRAVAAYARTPGARSVDYRIVGDGPLKPALCDLARALGVSDVVTFTGPKTQEGVVDELRRAHLLMAPSVVSADGDEEGIPVVLMEALATGLPVIGTSHSGIPELIDDGVSGLLVGERDPTALADAIARLVGDADAWAEMGRRGRRRIEADYNLDRLNDRLVELLEGMRRSEPRPGAGGLTNLAKDRRRPR